MSATYNHFDEDELLGAIVAESEPARPGTCRMRRWRQRNAERARIQSQVAKARYRAKQRGLEFTLTVIEWMGVLEQCDHCCLACGHRPYSLAIDHVRPQSLGGPTTLDNVQPLCTPCNKSKGQKTIDYRKVV